jgi:hypothetical protein
MKRDGFLSFFLLTVNSRKKKKKARNFIKNFDVSFSMMTCGTPLCGVEEGNAVLNSSNSGAEKTAPNINNDTNNNDDTSKGNIIGESKRKEENSVTNEGSSSTERFSNGTIIPKKSPKKLKIKYKNDDSEMPECDDNQNGECCKKNENGCRSNYRNKEEKTIPNSSPSNRNGMNSSGSNAEYFNENNNNSNKNKNNNRSNNDSDKMFFESFSSPTVRTPYSPFNVSITRIASENHKKELNNSSIEEYRRRYREGEREEEDREGAGEGAISVSNNYEYKVHPHEDVFDPLFLCLSPFILPLVSSYETTPVTPKTPHLPQDQPIRSPVPQIFNNVKKVVEKNKYCVGGISQEGSGIKGARSTSRSQSNLHFVASQIAQAKRGLAVRNFIDNKFYEKEMLNCTGESIFSDSIDSGDNLNTSIHRGDALNQNYSADVSNTNRSFSNRSSRNNGNNPSILNRSNSRVVSTMHRIFSSKGSAEANFETVLYGLQDLVFLFQMFRRYFLIELSPLSPYLVLFYLIFIFIIL